MYLLQLQARQVDGLPLALARRQRRGALRPPLRRRAGGRRPPLGDVAAARQRRLHGEVGVAQRCQQRLRCEIITNSGRKTELM